MPLINNSVFFIHIPRTGGRYIGNLFYQNNFDIVFNVFGNYFGTKNKVIDLPHLHYPYYTKFVTNNQAKFFTVVRNPITRFESMLKETNEDISKIFYNEENFTSFVNSSIMENKNNWFAPQVDFISHKTLIWKYEDGFEDDFFNWLYENFKFSFEKKDIDWEKDKREYDFKEKITLNEKQKKLIKEYYFKDFKILGY